jgi:protein-S-isoprenylcysteine O-methyltransferase Ste14
MSPALNVVISLIIVAAMVWQAVRAQAGSYKRKAYATASGAFGLLALFNVKTLLDGESGPWTVPVLIVVFVLIFVSVALLLKAWRNGEMQGQLDQVQEAIKQERIKRGIDDTRDG